MISFFCLAYWSAGVMIPRNDDRTAAVDAAGFLAGPGSLAETAAERGAAFDLADHRACLTDGEGHQSRRFGTRQSITTHERASERKQEAADDMDVRVGAGAPLVMARALVAPLDARRPPQRPQQRRLDAEDVGAFEQEAK